MKFALFKSWGIRERLVSIAVVPATIMFVVVSLSLYFASRDEIRSDISERGNILAAALAESSRYAVVSGNTTPLNQTLHGLLAIDRSIISLQITDAQRTMLTSVGDNQTELAEIQVFERPIRAQIPDVDVFDKTGGPHIAAPAGQSASFKDGNAVGYVRVVMSALPVLEAKRQRVYAGLTIVLLALVVSGIAGLILARRLRDPLNSVMTSLRGIREGNYDVRLDDHQRGELGELQSTIVAMAKSLSQSRQELESQVEARTSALQNAIELANQADEERRRLIARSNVVVEEERRRIALEIHDHLNAALLFVRLESQRMGRLAALLGSNADAKEIESVADRISATTADLYDAARTITRKLRPEQIDTLGLKGALEEMLRNYRSAHPECRFDFRAPTKFPKLSTELTITAYRVIQEALSNIVKHADASMAAVTLLAKPSQNDISITIEDDGSGFNVKKRVTSGIGLIGMRERVAAVGGSIKIVSDPNTGTKITIELPTKGG